MTDPTGYSLTIRPPFAHFHVKNWFQWTIDAHKMGYSNEDIRWILKTIGVWDEFVKAVEKWQSEDEI